MRERIAYETFGYTPVMIEHLFDEGLLGLREGRRNMNFDDVLEGEFGGDRLEAAGRHRAGPRGRGRTHEAGHATVVHFVGQNRRLEVLDHQAPGVARPARPRRLRERFARARDRGQHRDRPRGSGGRGLCISDTGTGPAADLAHATTLAANMVGSFGSSGLADLVRCDHRRADRWPEPGGQGARRQEGRQKVEDILEQQRQRVREVLELNADVHAALRDALIARDELVRDEILQVIEKALAARP